MANKLSLLSLSLCLLFLFNVCLASRNQKQNECQIDRLQALEPDNRVEYDAGLVETWDPNHEQFQCAGVAMLRITIQPNGLHLPSFSNSPQLIYIVQGEGMIGTLIPGCPETYQEPQEISSERGQRMRGSFQQDQHQKIRRFRRGDIVAIPTGVAYWTYNDANTPVVAVSLFDVSNNANQLDQIPRRFHLAGNPREEFQQQQQQRQPYSQRGRGQGQQQKSCNNVFCGFDTRILAEAFNVDERLISQLQTEEEIGAIIRVKGELGVITPPRTQREREREYEGEREYPGGRGGRGRESERERERWGGRDNGLEESICSMRLRANIGDPSRADFYTPQAGHITTVNGIDLPILRWLKLSAEKGTLHNNAIMVPHWHTNAHSVMYVTKGSAHFQIVDNSGNRVFDDEVREGQILPIPQNFAVVKRARSERFEYVAFRTNDNAMISPLSGRTSVIRAMPDEVLANAFQMSREDVRRLKYSNQQTLFTRGTSQMRAVA